MFYDVAIAKIRVDEVTLQLSQPGPNFNLQLSHGVQLNHGFPNCYRRFLSGFSLYETTYAIFKGFRWDKFFDQFVFAGTGFSGGGGLGK